MPRASVPLLPMSIYDRGYMNEDEPGAGGRSALQVLIFVNVALWLVWEISGARGNESGPLAQFLIDHFTVTVSGVLQHYRIYALVTHAFIHHDLGHIFWNMLFLWFLG